MGTTTRRTKKFEGNDVCPVKRASRLSITHRNPVESLKGLNRSVTLVAKENIKVTERTSIARGDGKGRKRKGEGREREREAARMSSLRSVTRFNNSYRSKSDVVWSTLKGRWLQNEKREIVRPAKVPSNEMERRIEEKQKGTGTWMGTSRGTGTGGVYRRKLAGSVRS